MGDVEAALGFVARRTARDRMPATEWAHHLSLGLGWMAPGQARAFVARAQAAGVLASEGEVLRLAVAPVEVPLGFRPDPEAAAAPKPLGDPFADWLEKVADRLGMPKPDVLAEVAARQARLGGLLTAWAALVWLAAEAGLDVRAIADVRA